MLRGPSEFFRTAKRSSVLPSGCEVAQIGSFKCGSGAGMPESWARPQQLSVMSVAVAQISQLESEVNGLHDDLAAPAKLHIKVKGMLTTPRILVQPVACAYF